MRIRWKEREEKKCWKRQALGRKGAPVSSCAVCATFYLVWSGKVLGQSTTWKIGVDDKALLCIVSKHWQPSHIDKFTLHASPVLQHPLTHGFEPCCAPAVSDKSCFLSVSSLLWIQTGQKKNTRDRNICLLSLWCKAFAGVSHKQAHNQEETAINLSRGEKVFQGGSLKTVSSGDLWKWGSGVHFEFVSDAQEECGAAVWTRLRTDVVVGAEGGRAW